MGIGFDEKVIVPNRFTLMGALVFAPAAFAQDVDCDENDPQAEEQAILAATPGDPNRLDEDNDGIAYEEPDGSSATSPSPSPSPSATASPDVTVQVEPPLTTLPTATASGSPTAAVGGALPATGGSGLALIASALLLGSGVLSYAVLRRK